jgi:5-hydroxyisourate hydrolase
MRRISTHILDIVHGKPARGVALRLEKQQTAGDWQLLNSAHTDQDGRCTQLLPDGEALSAAVYRLIFDSRSYYATQQIGPLYPAIEVTFQAREGESHFHIALLLGPNGYTTYRGS